MKMYFSFNFLVILFFGINCFGNASDNYALTKDEISAVNFYSRGGYSPINDCLRGNKRRCRYLYGEEYNIRNTELVKSALLKMKRIEYLTTYRGTANLPEAVFSRLNEPSEYAVIIDDGFMSSSLDRKEAESYGEFSSYEDTSPPLLFIISSKSCVDISMFSSFPREKEFLCPAGLKFFVKRDERNKNIYYLNEP